jgi:hypothetical protein
MFAVWGQLVFTLGGDMHRTDNRKSPCLPVA